METKEIKNIGISVDDIDLINKALDHYMAKDMGGMIMSGLLGFMIAGDDPVKMREFERRSAELERKRNRELDILKDDVRMVQGKIIQLKRLLIENNLIESLKFTPPL